MPDQSSRILVADDDPHIVDLVALYLERDGHQVLRASDGDQALATALEQHPSLVILDVMMPGRDGLQVCRVLRRQSDVPILLLSARAADLDRIAGLRLGADDYVTKPFNPDELVARVAAILRRARSQTTTTDALTVGALHIDLRKRLATVRGEMLPLPPREFDLLATLALFTDTTLDRDHLLDLAWGTTFYAARTVDVHVARLRAKLISSGVRIETVWGAGYRLTEDAEATP